MNSNIQAHFDVIVIGAGPAGMACAVTLSQHHLQVALLDENPLLGGQIYRMVDACAVDEDTILGADYTYGKTLTNAVRQTTTITHYAQTTVWTIETHGHENNNKAIDTKANIKYIYARQGDGSMVLTAEKVVLAGGAVERPMPVRGWTKSGVMTVGGAQTLLKTSGVVAENAIFVGSGPLLYLLTAQYQHAGIPIKAVLDTTPNKNYKIALKHSIDALRGWPLLLKGLKLLWQTQHHIIRGITNIEITGDSIATGVTYNKNGQTNTLQSPHIFLHQGIIPNLNMPLAIGCQSQWNPSGDCWQLRVGADNQTTVPGFYSAGDGVAIGGAKVAEYAGHQTALYVAKSLGRTIDKKQLKYYSKKCKQAWHARHFLNALYKPAQHYTIPTGDTIVCRCEEKTADDVVKAIKLGVQGPNQMKTFNRCGMGPCQGRYCGLTITHMMAHHQNRSPEQVGYYKIRPPFKPTTLWQMSQTKL